jgi:hypothetical protein
MFPEPFVTTLALVGLVLLRFGIPILLIWLLSKLLNYVQAVLP